MEARKLEQNQQQDKMGKAREVIREAIITNNNNKAEEGDDDDDCGGDHALKKSSSSSVTDNNLEKAEDVLAYSRAVHHTDSSLQ
ncbi:hypothetical protein C2S52_022044 [Perilla frutescens var. hirtella]|uniref:Uncharacterized protein n=1 Tax=Perilla frutescens var. hirtella TaxID=608512 RepID=A0AAD4IQ22_PERFH|nr:hypothetical protein C2S53_001107 [Perilla frutescens var. hirtella]KAH6797490.1 hypothetical protein C2S52_022044 [Perilla frutescens var. hirtella]